MMSLFQKRRRAALLVMLLALGGLSACAYQVYDYPLYALAFQPLIRSGDAVGAPGQEVTRALFVEGDFNGGRVIYSPPWGAMDLVFEGIQPAPGGPPYLFEPVSAGRIATVRYTLPPLRRAEVEKRVFDGLTAYTPAGDMNAAFFETVVRRADSPTVETPPQPADHLPGARRYEIRQSYGKPIALTTPMCQAWVNEIQQSRIFKAVRAPLQPPHAGESSPSPVAYPAAEPPGWRLLDQSGQPEQTLVSGSLAFDPALSARVSDRLPAAPGQTWVVFRPAGDSAPPPCPDGLNLEAGRWALETYYSLNLIEAPRSIVSFTCYEGQTAPAFFFGDLPTVQQTEVIHANGLTCVGPERLELGRLPDLELTGGGWQMLTPPGRLAFRHYLNPLSGPQQVNITISSDLDLPWVLYHSNGADTNPSWVNPVQLPVTIDRYQNIWAAVFVPPGTPPGPYRLDFTVTSVTDPAQTYTVTDLFWLGAWEAPAAAPPAPPERPAAFAPWLPPGPVTFTWQAGDGPTPLGYELMVDGVVVMTGSSTRFTLALAEGSHRWAVRAFNEGGSSAWSPTYVLGVGDPRLYFPWIKR